MKYIGATDFYVKIPFFLEGVILGIIGGAVAFLLLYFGYGAAIDYAGEHIAFFELNHRPDVSSQSGIVPAFGRCGVRRYRQQYCRAQIFAGVA